MCFTSGKLWDVVTIDFFVTVSSFPNSNSTSVCEYIYVNYSGHETKSISEIVEYERNFNNFTTTVNLLDKLHASKLTFSHPPCAVTSQ